MILESALAAQFSAVFEGAEVVVLHSAPRAIGDVAGGIDAIYSALMRACGAHTTVAAPAFSPQLVDPSQWVSPSAPRSLIPAIRRELAAFDVRTTSPSKMGRIVERMVHADGALRSRHPTESVVAIGPRALEIVAIHAVEDPMGPRSPWARLVALDARIVLLGVGLEHCSMLHHAERLAAVPYLDAASYRTFIDVDGDGRDESEPTRRWVDVVSGGACPAGFPKLEPALARCGAMASARIGGARVRVVAASRLVEVAVEALRADATALLCDDRICVACSRARLQR